VNGGDHSGQDSVGNPSEATGSPGDGNKAILIWLKREMRAMDFRKFPTILAILLLTVLVVPPVLSADNLADILSAPTVANVTNTTSDLNKDNATISYNRGAVLLNNGDYENAIRSFDQALASNTTIIRKTDAHLYTFQNKAYAQIQLGKYTDAIATLDEGLAYYPKDAMLWNNKGYALYRLGKTQDALAAYDKSVSFDSNYTIAHINRGDVLSQMGMYSEAVAAYTRANETDPFNIAASDGLSAAKKGESESTRTMTILIIIVIVAAIGIVVWYVKFRKPSTPAPEEKKAKSKKK
jgi:tetratricopeptide (TPR) repeat protein